MEKLLRNFQALHGRPPTTEEIASLQKMDRIGRNMGLRDNDALWQIMMLMDANRIYLEEVPPQIKKTTLSVLGEVRKTADRVSESAISRAMEKMADRAAETVDRVAHRVTGRDRLKWGAIFGVVLLMVGSAGFYAGYTARDGQLATLPARLSSLIESGEGKVMLDLALYNDFKKLLNMCRDGKFPHLREYGADACQMPVWLSQPQPPRADH